MMEFERLPIEEIRGTFACECGQEHVVTTQEVLIGNALVGKMATLLGGLGTYRRIGMVYDDNTWAAAGERVYEALKGDYEIVKIRLGGHGALHADEGALGAIMMGVYPKCDLILAVGSGTINDLCRYSAYLMQLPYVLIGTAPSMDGLCSSVSPLTQRGMKITFEAISPTAVYLDLDVLCKAPAAMIAAGLGDMMGKYTALRDWELAQVITGEYRCEALCRMMDNAAQRCLASAPKLSDRDEGAIKELTQGLVLSGLAMQMMGNSRPASGSEHHLSHFWEMRAQMLGEQSTLHGDKVGVAELLMMDFYGRFYQKLPVPTVMDGQMVVDALKRSLGPVAQEVLAQSAVTQDLGSANAQREKVMQNIALLRQRAQELAQLSPKVKKVIKDAGGPTHPKEMGLSEQDVMDAILCAMHLRTRFTLLRMAYEWGAVKDIADEMIEEWYA